MISKKFMKANLKRERNFCTAARRKRKKEKEERKNRVDKCCEKIVRFRGKNTVRASSSAFGWRGENTIMGTHFASGEVAQCVCVCVCPPAGSVSTVSATTFRQFQMVLQSPLPSLPPKIYNEERERERRNPHSTGKQDP